MADLTIKDLFFAVCRKNNKLHICTKTAQDTFYDIQSGEEFVDNEAVYKGPVKPIYDYLKKQNRLGKGTSSFEIMKDVMQKVLDKEVGIRGMKLTEEDYSKREEDLSVEKIKDVCFVYHKTEYDIFVCKVKEDKTYEELKNGTVFQEHEVEYIGPIQTMYEQLQEAGELGETPFETIDILRKEQIKRINSEFYGDYFADEGRE